MTIKELRFGPNVPVCCCLGGTAFKWNFCAVVDRFLFNYHLVNISCNTKMPQLICRLMLCDVV